VIGACRELFGHDVQSATISLKEYVALTPIWDKKYDISVGDSHAISSIRREGSW